MSEQTICDSCRFYYAYGLTHGTCMHHLLSKKSRKDKDVKYYDTCEQWTENNDLKERQTLIFTYEALKKEYAICKSNKQN